ncbi:MAG: AMP-binding protein, partial [Thermoanaerobaculia bacterium]|nr:AMP-binding protein [Thermoanaerobaculia bacterium]
PLAGIEVRISAEGEIQVRGATVMRGYFAKPEATAAAFVDGWLKTGDAGALDGEGNLTITDRLKDLIKTSGGKYVAPQQVEAHLGGDSLIAQAAVLGDLRKFVAALIVPAFAALEEWARAAGIDCRTRAELIAHPRVVALYQERVELHNRRLAPWEQIRRFRLLARELTVEEGEITPTLKVRRQQLAAEYAALVDAMYAEG